VVYGVALRVLGKREGSGGKDVSTVMAKKRKRRGREKMARCYRTNRKRIYFETRPKRGKEKRHRSNLVRIGGPRLVEIKLLKEDSSRPSGGKGGGGEMHYPKIASNNRINGKRENYRTFLLGKKVFS